MSGSEGADGKVPRQQEATRRWPTLPDLSYLSASDKVLQSSREVSTLPAWSSRYFDSPHHPDRPAFRVLPVLEPGRYYEQDGYHKAPYR